ncbi:MAG: SPOR domain-containing protein [Pseudomonadota bacterium]
MVAKLVKNVSDRTWLWMLRGVFFALLLANLGYYAFGTTQTRRGPVALPPLPPGVAELKLIAEREAEMLVTDGDLGGNLTSECFSLGPFTNQSDLRRAAQAMSPYVGASRQRQDQRLVDRGFWVYLPAVATREEAINQARSLSEAGLNDYYVVTGGDRENTVSLGLFREQNNAMRRRRSLQALGFEAEIARRQEEAVVYWFDYRRAGDEAPWKEVLASLKSVGQKPIPCFR